MTFGPGWRFEANSQRTPSLHTKLWAADLLGMSAAASRRSMACTKLHALFDWTMSNLGRNC